MSPNYTVFDIETVASPNAAVLLDPVKAPSNYKDPVKIAAYVADEFEQRVKKAGLEADLCEVCCIGYQRADDLAPTVVTRREMSEADLLARLWRAIGDSPTIGYNSLGFDLPVLIRRSQLLDVRYPRITLDRYRTEHIDLSEELSFRGKLPYRSLGFYARLFRVPCTPDLVNGSDIAGLVAAGEWDAVAHHCRCDVEETAALARRLGYLDPVSVAS